MKPNRLLTALVIFTLSAGLFSCKKTGTADLNGGSDAEAETTIELSGDQAVADNLTEDANNAFMEAAANKNLMGSNLTGKPVETSNILSCASISVSSTSGFPKTIVIDFGAGSCVSNNGVFHKGKINVVLTDSVCKPGSKATMTFINYYVNNFKKEGTVTWTNTSIPSTRSWQRKIENGKITAPNGMYWMHSGTRDVVQIAGANTPGTLMDDVFLTTGNHTVTNAAGKTRDCFITEALQKKTTCDNITAGKLKVQGAAGHYALIDFGNGDCDKTATIAIDGQAPKTITLR